MSSSFCILDLLIPVPFVEKLWIVPDVFWLAAVPSVPAMEKSLVACCVRGLGSPAADHLLDGELAALLVEESSAVITSNETEGESSNVSIIIPVDAD